jgi:hypothetical protein
VALDVDGASIVGAASLVTLEAVAGQWVTSAGRTRPISSTAITTAADVIARPTGVDRIMAIRPD